MFKKISIFLIKIAALICITSLIGTGIRVVIGIMAGEHGAPDFLSTGFTIYGIVEKLLLVVTFLLLGNLIPIKNRMLRGLIFILLYWGSSYIPQVLGMLGGHSANISTEAFNLSTIFADSLGYIVKGAVLGVILGKGNALTKVICEKTKYVKACVISMLLFPIILAVFEVLGGLIWSKLYCINAFEIAQTDYLSFYIVFYFFQAVSGLIFPIFYRMTEYNCKQNWLKFACILAWLIWFPIVMIMVFFGADVLVTIIWGLMMGLTIYIDVRAFTLIMNGGSK